MKSRSKKRAVASLTEGTFRRIVREENARLRGWVSAGVPLAEANAARTIAVKLLAESRDPLAVGFQLEEIGFRASVVDAVIKEFV